MIQIETHCRECHNIATLNVRDRDYRAWRNGAMVQNAFPYLSADDRELLISQTCGKCWDELFAFPGMDD